MFRCLQIGMLLCALSLKLVAQNCAEIIGYYPNWQWYDRAKLVNPMTIKYEKYTIINYAFFKPELTGAISSTDTWADENLLLGQINWSTSPVSYYPNTSIIARAHNANKKVLPSIGGWTLSDNFPSIAASSIKRATFAHGCCDLIRTYGFDGIDIDWEYPGLLEHGGTPADKQNFTLLMQTIKDSLAVLGSQQNKTYLLTACFGASKSNMLNIEWANVINILDIANIMTYDYFGSWDANANHNSPLYKSSQGDATYNLDSSISYLMNHYQVPANKLAAGVAFYGRAVKTSGTPALFAPILGVDNITFSDDDGNPTYFNLLKKQNLFTNHWDAMAQVPYLTGNGGLQSFVSYDDEQSIGLKAAYIKNKNLRGAIIWEITGDYLETSPGSGVIGSTPLIDTLNAVLCNNISSCVMPSGILASSMTENSTALSWNGSNATSYVVEYKKQNEIAWITLPTTSTSINVGNLLCNTNYHVRVKSICGVTSSGYSSIYSFTTLACTNPTVTISPAGTLTICNGASQPLVASPGFNTYLWSNGATTQSIVVSAAGAYQVTATTSNNSTTVSNVVNIITTNCPLNTPPTVSIISPLNNMVVTGGSTTLVNVNANDSDGTISSVELYVNNSLYGVVTTPPYNFSVINNSTGVFSMFAKAIDNAGANTLSNVINYSVIPNAISACNYPLWNSSTIYAANDTVLFNNIIYKAKYWSQNNMPSNNYGNCCVWDYVIPCGGYNSTTCFKPTYDPIIAYNTNQEVYWNGNVYRAKWWTLNEHPSSNAGSGGVWLLLSTPCYAQMDVKAFMQGYYTGSSTMSSVMYNSGSSTNTNYCDTVIIECHDILNPFGLSHSFTGVMNINGLVSCRFPSTLIGNSFYIVVRHRNSLETWSASPVLIQANSTYDFSTAANQAFGENQKELESGVYGLYSGDINQDGYIDGFDYPALDDDSQNNVSGVYVATDLNGDGYVDGFDYPVFDANSQNNVTIAIP